MLGRLTSFGMGWSDPAAVGPWICSSVAIETPLTAVRPGANRGMVRAEPLFPGVALLTWDQIALQQDRWSDLAGRALEPNVFMEPGFALSAAQHAAPAHRPLFLTITEPAPDGDIRLLGIVPLTHKNGSLGKVARLWRPPAMALGVPLIDRDKAALVVDAAFAWLNANAPEVDGLLLSRMMEDGPTAMAFRRSASRGGHETLTFDAHRRAILSSGGENARALPAMSGERAKEYRRLRRRLAERGTLELKIAESRAACHSAFERFLMLESSGWKGQRGTALLCNLGLATFGRTMIRSFARDGQCRIYSLELDGRAVASCVVLSSGSRAYLWKIAYDEFFAEFSPGVLLMLDVTQAQLADTQIGMTDSCADPDHPMIDRLWQERVGLCDLMIATKRDGEAFRAVAQKEANQRRLRTLAKRVYHWLLRR